MKTKLLSLLVFLSFIGCQSDLQESPASETQESHSIPDRDVAILESMGFCTKEISDIDSCYVVERDIIIDKSSLEFYSQQTRQVRWKNLISNVNRISVSVNLPGDNGWEAAVWDALRE